MTETKTNFMKRIIQWLFCNILDSHSWTCKAEQGIKPTDKEIEDGVDGFNSYAKMFCEHCGKESKLNSRYGRG